MKVPLRSSGRWAPRRPAFFAPATSLTTESPVITMCTSGRAIMATEDNKGLVRRFYAEIDAGNIDAMDELVAEDYVDHNPPFPGLPAGREGLKQAFRVFWKATPGRHEIEDQVAEGDKVVTRLMALGRHEDELPGPLPATGADLRETAVAIHRIANGRIAEHWSDRDDLALMQQLGVITLPGG